MPFWMELVAGDVEAGHLGIGDLHAPLMGVGLLRPFCRRCDVLLTSRAEEAIAHTDMYFTEGVLALQRQAERLVKEGSDRRVQFEYALRTLWAPLDQEGAAQSARSTPPQDESSD